MMIKRFLFISIIALLCSCKVTYSLLDSSIDAETFSVAIFEEQAANSPAGYGISFTEYLRDYVVSRSKLKLTKEDADIEISGKIINYNTTPVSIQSNESAATNRLTIGIGFIDLWRFIIKIARKIACRRGASKWITAVVDD